MIDILRELCSLYGASGDEKDVAAYIADKLKNVAGLSVEIDALGSVIVFKKGVAVPKNKVLLDAHTDEVGLMINDISTDGFLSFDTVGGIDPAVLIGRRVVVGKARLPSVIGLKPMHLLAETEKKTMPAVRELCIDIGALCAEEAEERISVGAYAYFDSDFIAFGDGKVKCRAIDDRFGCAVMLALLLEPLQYDTWFSFSVQEEVGLRGASASAFSIAPDCALVLEATTAADIPDVEGGARVCVQGEGPAVSFMDRSTVYDKKLYKTALDAAQRAGVKCQSKTLVAGGNDAGAIHKSRGGVRTLTVSLPCRYIHSGACVADTRDMEESLRFLRAVLPIMWND